MKKSADNTPTMLRYLKATKPKCLYVIGNESADMDSCCSALVTAYLYQKLTGVSTTPVLNLSRKGLKIRRDVVYVFNELEVSENDFAFVSDLNLKQSDEVLLVDHNVPTVPGTVKGILDHHAIEGVFTSEKYDPFIIEPAGSCMSVVLKYFSTKLSLSVFEDPILKKLCAAPLLLDTNNLTKKCLPIDFAAAKLLGIDPTTTTKMYKGYKKKRDDITGLTAQEVLLKDYKRWNGLGMSSLTMSFDKLLQIYPNFTEAMRTFKKSMNLELFVATTACNSDKGFSRELAAVGGLKFPVPSLLLEQKFVLDNVVFYNQGDSSASRKQIAPLLRAGLDRMI